MDPDVLKDPHHGFEEVRDGLRIFGTTFFVDYFPFGRYFIGDVFIKEFIRSIGIGPIDFITMFVLVFVMLATVSGVIRVRAVGVA